MTRTPAYLAAVASSAVPGLDAVAVRASRGAPGNRCDVGFVTDTQRRAWVVRVPTTPAIGAQLDTAADLLPLLHRRVPYGVPLPRGFLAIPDGRAVVYPYLHGRSVVLGEVVPGPGVAAEIGRAIAALHNVDRAVFDEAGVPVYDAETCRTRHLADLDRGAATGHVPTALLSRWEQALEDVSAWRFAPTPVHADLTGGRFLVTFSDDDDPDTAKVRAVTGWEHAKVADPAEDFAVIVADCSPETLESIVEAYSVARIERPDRHLRHRAKLVSELRLLNQLLDAVHAAEPPLITRRAAELRALDERTADEPDLVVTEPESSIRMPAAGFVAAAGAPATATATEAASEVHAEDTQPLKTGAAADATAVIPAEELDRLRAEPTDRTDSQAAADGETESWYEVLEPGPSLENGGAATHLTGAGDSDHAGEDEVVAEPDADNEDEHQDAEAVAAEPDTDEDALEDAVAVVAEPDADDEDEHQDAVAVVAEPDAEPDAEAEPDQTVTTDAAAETTDADADAAKITEPPNPPTAPAKAARPRVPRRRR